MRRVLLAAPLAAVMLASPSPAAAQPWVVAPASDGAEIISQLFWFTLVLATIVFVLVEGLLIYSSLRFRRRAPKVRRVRLGAVHPNRPGELRGIAPTILTSELHSGD